jgi:predicted transcriptional regulator
MTGIWMLITSVVRAIKKRDLATDENVFYIVVAGVIYAILAIKAGVL